LFRTFNVEFEELMLAHLYGGITSLLKTKG